MPVEALEKRIKNKNRMGTEKNKEEQEESREKQTESPNEIKRESKENRYFKKVKLMKNGKE